MAVYNIHATDVAIGLRRIPAGFYALVEIGPVAKKTSIKPVSVRKDVVEWDDEIILWVDGYWITFKVLRCIIEDILQGVCIV